MSLIQAPPRKVRVLNEWGSTDDIIKALMLVVDRDWPKEQVAKFAQQYRGATDDEQYRLCKKLWRFVRDEIKYQEDPQGTQDLKHPARTWAERNSPGADCKSKSIFIYYVLRAIEIPCFLRFASYWDEEAVRQARSEGKDVAIGQIGHVYPVAIIGGRSVAMDSVYERFDSELRAVKLKDRFPKAWDTPEMRRLARQAKQVAIAGPPADGVPRWVSGLTAAACTIQFFRADGVLDKIIYGGLGYHFAKKTFAQQ